MSAAPVLPALVDLGKPLLERIVLVADENRAARLVCKQWRDIVDCSGTPFWFSQYGNSKPVALLVLRGPRNSTCIQGCLSWCRRNGRKHEVVELWSSSSWWFLPAAPLCHLSNATKVTIRSSYLPEEHSLALLSPLTRLQSLKLRNVGFLEKSLQPLTCLRSLRHLSLRDCPQVRDLEAVGQLTSLTSFSMYDHNYSEMRGLHDLCQLTGLQSLALTAGAFRAFQAWSALQGLTGAFTFPSLIARSRWWS